MEGKKIGNWTIEQRIDEGGMGVVWKARHEILSRPVAIKVMHQHLMRDPQIEARFVQEASAQSRLQHPHIVSVSDFFRHDGTYHLVMPFIESASLEQRILRAKGPLPLAEALHIAQDVLSALDYAHQQGVIHRDVKPSNILLDHSGRAYLADFGIALQMGQPRKSTTGRAIGTAHYMSPEQIVRPKDLDHRTDVYGFGCVLYEMLAGKAPFEADPEQGDTDFFIKQCHLTQKPAPLRSVNSTVPEPVEAIVMCALEKDENARFVSCGEFARALAQTETPALPVVDNRNLIHCPHCKTLNRIAPETMPTVNCEKCGKKLNPVREVPTGSGWKTATGLLAALLVICLFGLFVVAGSQSKVQSELNYERDKVSSLTSKVDGLTKENEEVNKKLDSEKKVRSTLAKSNPITLSDIKLTYKHVSEGGPVSFVDWSVTLQNNAVGLNLLEGKLKVKFIKPDGTLDRGSSSPLYFTQEKDISIKERESVSSSWGCDQGGCWQQGSFYRIEFWWEGKKIGDKDFKLE